MKRVSDGLFTITGSLTAMAILDLTLQATLVAAMITFLIGVAVEVTNELGWTFRSPFVRRS